MKTNTERRASKSEAVQEFCRKLWDGRKRGALAAPEELSRELALAIAADVAEHAGYDPDADHRTAWARILIRELRERPQRTPRADGDTEAIVAWLLDRMPTPTGKALAFADA